jgi:hypothetical protein
MIRGLRLPLAAPNPEAINNREETRTPQLAALLSLGVISCLYVLRAVGVVSTGWAASLGHLLSDVLLIFPLAFAAIRVGQWLARRLGIAEESASGLFARAALIAGIFALFLAAASGLHQVLDRAFGTTPTHAFHGQSRSVESDWAVDIASIARRGIREAILGYLAALPLMFVGLALLSGKNRDGPINAERPDSRAQAARAGSVVPTAIALAVAAAGVVGLTLTSDKPIHRDRRGLIEHAQMVTRIPVGIDFEVHGVHVTVQSAQWVRQPPPAVEPIAAPRAGNDTAGAFDRIYLEVTFENVAASLRSVGRGEFRMLAANGASWAPLADDFPDILLGPAEKLTTRFIFEVPPQTAQLEFVPTDGAAEARIPIGDDIVGGLFGEVCRALSKPRKG